MPVIGPSPLHDNLYLAFGHAHTGMCGGPNTGRMIAGMIAGQPLNIDRHRIESIASEQLARKNAVRRACGR